MRRKTPAKILAEHKKVFEKLPPDKPIPEIYINLLRSSYSFSEFDDLRGMIFVRCPLKSNTLYEFGLTLCLDFCQRRRQKTYYFISPVGRSQVEADFLRLCPKKYAKFFETIEFNDYEHLCCQLVKLFEESPKKKINVLIDSINWLQILDDRYSSADDLALLAETLNLPRRHRVFALGEDEAIGIPPPGTTIIDLPPGEISNL